MKIERKGFVNNHLTDIYGIQVNKVTLSGKQETLRTEPVDIKDFTDLQEQSKALLEENNKELEKAKLEKREWYIQKILVVL